MFASREEGRHQLKAAAGVAALHGLFGYLLLTGLGYEVGHRAGDRLKVFDVVEPPPPPIEAPVPAKVGSKAPEGAAAPPNVKSKPSPIVAPLPKTRLPVPPPVRTAPLPPKVPPGSDSSAGAADVAGTGSGSGGTGAGPGSGGEGSGSGGGVAVRAQRLSGGLADEDYPAAALRAGLQGTVKVRYTVDTDGRARHCTITRSSGHAELDATTCRLIEQRFRYRPARDRRGIAVPEAVSKTYSWLLPFGR